MMKMIIAVVRTTDVKKIETALVETGVRGFTLSKVKGIGEEKAFLDQDLVVHMKFELIVPENDVERLTRVIVDTAWTGCAGDGILAILPVETYNRIRAKGTSDP